MTLESSFGEHMLSVAKPKLVGDKLTTSRSVGNRSYDLRNSSRVTNLRPLKYKISGFQNM